MEAEQNQDSKDELAFVAYIEAGKKQFGCDIKIEQTAVLVQVGKDGITPIMSTGVKCVIQIQKVHPKVEMPTEGEVLDFARAKNGG